MRIESRPSLSSVTAIVVAALATAASISAQDPAAIRGELTQALAPAGSEQVDVVLDSTPLAPRVLFFRGRRIPRIVNGEQSRPTVVALVQSGDSSALITRIDEIPKAWAIVCPRTVSDNAGVDTALVLAILRLTGIRPESYILRDASTLQANGSVSLLKNKFALAKVRPPSATAYAGGRIVRIFTDERRGIFLNEFVLAPGCKMKLRRTLVTAYRNAF